MGNSPEALLSRWDEVLKDSCLQDLPYKSSIRYFDGSGAMPGSRYGVSVVLPPPMKEKS